jgi:putative nucleotidyltransferase with HDIG domain
MAKPCDPEMLIKTIQSACGLHSQLQDVSLKNLTSQISCLPSLPSIYKELVEELESDDASMDRVGTMISSDLAMTAKVLQLVNSSFFGLPQHVTCPNHAVSLLGLSVIRPLVLTAKAFSEFEDPKVDGFSLEAAVQNSLAVAIAAKRIAEVETDQSQMVDDAFMAGMLHDIGKLILAVNMPERFAEAAQLARQGDIPMWKAELEVFGTTHAEVGAHLLGLWGLPDPIVEAVAFHHRPGNAASTGFTPLAAVHFASAMQSADSHNEETLAESGYDSGFIESIDASDRLAVWTSLIEQESVA